jgi:hypothetical protein
MIYFNFVGDILDALCSKDRYSAMDVLDDLYEILKREEIQLESYEEDALDELLGCYNDIDNELEKE